MRQDVVDVLKTSRMNLVRALIGVSSYAVHRWHVAVGVVQAAILFAKAGRERRERRDDNWTLSTPVSYVGVVT